MPKRILLLDITLDYLPTVADVLRADNNEVYITETVEGALELLSLHEFHFVISHFRHERCPGFSSLEIISHLEGCKGAPQAIFITDDLPLRYAEEIKGGRAIFIRKPILPESLLGMINSTSFEDRQHAS